MYRGPARTACVLAKARKLLPHKLMPHITCRGAASIIYSDEYILMGLYFLREALLPPVIQELLTAIGAVPLPFILNC